MKRFQVEVDENGKLAFTEEFNLQYGLKPGVKVYVDETAKGPRLRLPVTHLKKVYIEPTNRCNLDCRFCMRHAWQEPLGQMSTETFSRILDGLKEFSPPPTIFFGAMGEPLAHPDILDMVVQAKALGSSVELITNGTLLTRDVSKRLIDAGLDVLWTSLDGVTPESYGDLRLGALLPEVLANLKTFRQSGWRNPNSFPGTGYQIKRRWHRFRRDEEEHTRIAALLEWLQNWSNSCLGCNVLPYTPEWKRRLCIHNPEQKHCISLRFSDWIYPR
jgi:pyruvate-formate lyase-activating enzyme